MRSKQQLAEQQIFFSFTTLMIGVVYCSVTYMNSSILFTKISNEVGIFGADG